MRFRMITISREFGSGGRTIGKAIAAALGYAYYDNELVTQIAQKSGFSEKYIKESGEYAGNTSGLLFDFNNFGTGSYTTNSDYLYVVQRNLIQELANQGPCVIVGRCADYILRERCDCLHVFIHANMDFREERIVRLYGELEEASAKKRIQKKDKQRATYYKYYTNRKWGVAQNYHMCLDSSVLGIENCVDMITQVVRKSEGKEINE